MLVFFAASITSTGLMSNDNLVSGSFRIADLFLDTASLDPATKAAVEVLVESRTSRSEREILKFRHLFQREQDKSMDELMVGQTELRTVFLCPRT